MSLQAELLRSSAHGLSAALRASPAVKLDLRGADLNSIVSIIVALIDRGVATRDKLLSYLDRHGCRFGTETLDFVLNQFDGGDSRRDLWQRDRNGKYSLLYPLK